ncbi:hypothetical protein C8A01DRAFT_37947 [Parachaetomium inaequale]|uniref:Uncharacterized protein n=1 Tax=Parachaetomium inaequale TaxID=2588326 RepID=A0AAN6PBX1_9PEZI|nr:hypothetical protein C8A01DRAFT_37947 [Parachaetomium inaequale]
MPSSEPLLAHNNNPDTTTTNKKKKAGLQLAAATPSLWYQGQQQQQQQHPEKVTPAAPPYTAKEAAGFVRLGACMVAWPPEEVWVDPFRGEGAEGVAAGAVLGRGKG